MAKQQNSYNHAVPPDIAITGTKNKKTKNIIVPFLLVEKLMLLKLIYQWSDFIFLSPDHG